MTKEKSRVKKNDEEHMTINDPTQFPHEDMEELAKKAIKKFKSLS